MNHTVLRVDATLFPREAYVDIPVESTAVGGLIISNRDGLGIATVICRRAKKVGLMNRIREHFGLELPGGPYRTVANDFAIAGIGPDTWLATSDCCTNAFDVSLRQAIGYWASVFDQSDSYAVLRLSGPKVRETLCKLVPINLH